MSLGSLGLQKVRIGKQQVNCKQSVQLGVWVGSTAISHVLINESQKGLIAVFKMSDAGIIIVFSLTIFY